jgi:HAD superfamily hydrolase (TIGR01509 family)|tara:strand:+ start:191 stop:763 length:573 start_codon:yes stop_codon:yes gene_type:complete
MKTLIFDLDGTLIDCKPLHQSGFRWAVKQQCPSAEFTDAEIEGLPTTQKIKYLQHMGYDVTMSIDELKREHTRAHIHEYVTYNEDIAKHFQRLCKNYKLCLASNSRSEFVFKCLNILDLWQFECVYSRDYGPSKPDPWMFNECMRICDSKPSNTVIFEDSVVGIKAARATGSETIEVKDSNNLIEILYEF